MAEVTVKELADTVGRPVETLLAQMGEAGLNHKKATDAVSDSEKQQLLAHLKRAHGEQAGEPRKITLQRKTVSTLKTSAATGGRAKTVNVEVRKTRTYVKRSVLEEQEDKVREAEEAKRLEAEAAVRQAEEAKQAAIDAEKRAAEDARVAAAEEEARKAAEEARKQLGNEPKDSRKLSVPKVDVKRLETPEEKARREEEAAKARAADEVRKRQEDVVRREAEEKAREKTLEQAQKIAAELAVRKEDGTAAAPTDAPLARGLVGVAYEDSFAREDREIKRGGGTNARGGKKGPKKREEQAFRQTPRTLTSALSKKHGFEKPVEKQVYEVAIGENIVVSDLAQKMARKSRDVIRVLMKMGEMVNESQSIDQATAALVVEEMGHTAVFVSDNALEDSLMDSIVDHGDDAPRAPVVTIMGHVDHGKTSLLDAIRRAKVAAGEVGGITQHIGAYHVETPRGMVTFLDTPGHAAFTAMRSRGAKATDIVILVVAADDGVMPQTAEAIDHARAANVPLIVAINKMDKESADPDRVQNELSAKGVVPEDWGGDTQIVKLSAHSGDGIDNLLDAILLQAEVLELRASTKGAAQGVVIESRIDKGRGAVATLLVQKGTLKKGDLVLAGTMYGRARALTDENGKLVKAVGPSMPVEILGLPEAPGAGDEFLVVADERKAREVAEFRLARDRQVRMDMQQAMKLENVFANMGKKEAASVNIVLKADVRGSLEALTAALHDLGTDEVVVKIVSSGVGAIAESDVTLAESTGSVVLGFNVRADNGARAKCQNDGIDLRYYSIIYELLDDVKAAMSGLLSPERRENIVGMAEVREVFHSSKFGHAAGCMVLEGSLFRNKPIRVLREDVVVFQGELESLRRYKDDVPEVRHGMECGLAVRGYKDIQAGDKIEVYEIQIIKRSL
ncbi:translation initiation factor IF-2 [Paraperlucidibaca baekdonensis]|uniref:Translation initiation factor IF-2 n=1 Tax=Paraperlucidibaca baekdonensis TaxID=748120 RepID=A0A3E0H8N4_9GAMM|nr:translation initiation factor IF-2 [Paraperlucidibaca baekdonensis]REH39840.1 translation initiation factor IF-2 [Paraperlucidibaca baekdonensis]